MSSAVLTRSAGVPQSMQETSENRGSMAQNRTTTGFLFKDLVQVTIIRKPYYFL